MKGAGGKEKLRVEDERSNETCRRKGGVVAHDKDGANSKTSSPYKNQLNNAGGMEK
jgi:hypothetical protein